MRLTIKHQHSKGASGSNGAVRHHADTNGAGDTPRLDSVLRMIQTSSVAHLLETSVEELRETLLQILSGVRPLVPRVRVREAKGALSVSTRLEGVDSESLEVAFEGKVIRMSGAWTHRQESLRRNFRRVESTFRTFERTIPIGDTFDRDKAVATFSRDVLRINVPLREAKSTPLAETTPPATEMAMAGE
jgi:HSP20 family molecular chaperone IbpA